MYHVNPKGEARLCRAQRPSSCRFYQGEEDTRHFESQEEAQAFGEELLKREHGGGLQGQRRYSFVKAFEEQEKKFQADFEGVPTRFYSTELDPKGRLLPTPWGKHAEDPLTFWERYVSPERIWQRTAQVVTTPQDGDLPEAEVMALLRAQGITKVWPIDDRRTLAGFKCDEAWLAHSDNGFLIIPRGGQGAKNFTGYSFRKALEQEGQRVTTFTVVDVRTLVGIERVRRLTGINYGQLLTLPPAEPGDKEGFLARRRKRVRESVAALLALGLKQQEGANFVSQRKYLKEQQGAIATAWMDKKGPDKVHQELMKTTVLNEHFRQVEIDNEVDPEEFKKFEEDYLKVRGKLPAIPPEMTPELRIRKLGKHKASGVFFGHKNTVAIDVRDSGSFIHEMGHQYDLIVKQNASLSSSFASITRSYGKQLAQEPSVASKFAYYTTPTEIFARGFEIYAAEKLGIKGTRLLDEGKFEGQAEYKPLVGDPKLKAEVFAFFDKLLGE